MRRLVAAFFALVTATALCAQSSWLPANSGTSQDLWGVCYDGSSRYVAVGTAGTIVSGGPSTWTPQQSGTSVWLLAVTYGSMFVAVGDQGTILTSPDAVHWMPQNSGTTQRLNGVAYGTLGGAPFYLAVGEAGTVCTSSDGLHWTARSAGVSGWLRGVAAYTVTLAPMPATTGFVVAGQNGVVLKTGDGVAFTPVSTGTTQNIESVVLISDGSSYRAAMLTAGGGGLIGQLMVSPMGDQWTGVVAGTTANYYRGAAVGAVVGQAGAVAVANPSPALGAAVNSSFAPLTLNPPNDLNAVVEVGGSLLVVGRAARFPPSARPRRFPYPPQSPTMLRVSLRRSIPTADAGLRSTLADRVLPVERCSRRFSASRFRARPIRALTKAGSSPVFQSRRFWRWEAKCGISGPEPLRRPALGSLPSVASLPMGAQIRSGRSMTFRAVARPPRERPRSCPTGALSS